MHDGRFDTLRAVIDHYNLGVQNNPNLSPPLRLRNKGVKRFNLSENEINALVAFLKTHGDTLMMGNEKFSNPFKEA